MSEAEAAIARVEELEGCPKLASSLRNLLHERLGEGVVLKLSDMFPDTTEWGWAAAERLSLRDGDASKARAVSRLLHWKLIGGRRSVPRIAAQTMHD